MKRLIIGMIAIITVLSAVGCSESNSSEVKNENTASNSSSSAYKEESSSDEQVFTKPTEQQPEIKGNVIASGDCGENGGNVKWKLYDEGLLVIEGIGKMEDYPIDRSSVGDGWGNSSKIIYTTPWKDYNERIKFVVVSEGVTYIGNGSFAGADVESMQLPESLESFSSYIGGLDHLSTFKIPKGVKKIGSEDEGYGVGLCINANLENIEVDDDNEYFSSVDGVLYNKDKSVLISCPHKKTTVVIPDGVKTIGAYAFYDCVSISSIELPASVTSIEMYAFASCTELVDINIPYGVHTIGNYAFERSTKITSIIIPSSVTSIGIAAFSDCAGPVETTDHERITIKCDAGSYAEKYAKENRLKYEYIG